MGVPIREPRHAPHLRHWRYWPGTSANRQDAVDGYARRRRADCAGPYRRCPVSRLKSERKVKMNSAVKSQMHPSTARPAKDGVVDADPSISRFLDAVWMERGLSQNTLAAYRADLTALTRWLDERRQLVTRTTRADLVAFIAWRVEAGARPRYGPPAVELPALLPFPRARG